MTEPVAIRIVDVFTDKPFNGNPAAVVLNARDLTDIDMQRIAAEMNLSETAFVLPAQASDDEEVDFHLRWFTPTTEVKMCGHATLAAVHALHQAGLIPAASAEQGDIVTIQTAGGQLRAHREAPGAAGTGSNCPLLWLELVRPTLRLENDTPEIWADLLGLRPDQFVPHPPPVRTQDGDLILFVKDAATLNAAQPVVPELTDFCTQQQVRGVCLATTATSAPAVHVQSRFFAPAAGILEDPVTGSVHGPLGVHLVQSGLAELRDGVAALACLQGTPSGRTGLVRVVVLREADGGLSVRIGGQCVTVLSGGLHLDGQGAVLSAEAQSSRDAGETR